MKKNYEKFKLMLSNTLTNQREHFIPINFDQVKMYVCGITPYDYPHIGHGRCYVTFDVLFRLLKFLEYKVVYCRNFTDIDDKLIIRAQRERNNPQDFNLIAQEYIAIFNEDMKNLNCLSPDFEPRVTGTINQIITFIQGLIDKNKAYVSDGDVYFSIDNFKDYGKLSKRDLDELKIGARVEVRQDKVNPLDFALWKKSDQAPGWDSPWSFGRPGWHIECSAMAKEFLGESIDIHGGGMDLIFPHHENEIAQSEALSGKKFSNFWMHIAFVRINQEKMSKSLGNFITLRDICNKFNPQLVRYYYLIHHYRNPLDFSYEDIEAASKSYQKLAKFFDNYQSKVISQSDLDNILINSLIEALCDDINIAKFFGIIFENLKYLESNEEQAQQVKFLIQEILGLQLKPIEAPEVIITSQIKELLEKREQARLEKNWQLADKIRDQLKELGIDAHDKKIK